jgi:excisionase family DNA binding protein
MLPRRCEILYVGLRAVWHSVNGQDLSEGAIQLRSSSVTKESASTPIQSRLLNVRAAAAYLSCTVWAVRNLVWNRDVPSLKIGNRILFDRKDLDAFIERIKTK